MTDTGSFAENGEQQYRAGSAVHGLSYARQFLLGPRCDPRLVSWPRLELQNGLMVQHHPLLSGLQKKQGDRSVTLLGFALAAARPAWTHADILAHLLDSAESLDDLFAETELLSGRWVLVYENPGRSVLLHDAAGLRTVVHTLPKSGETWCASQTSLLANQLNLTPEARAVDFWDVLGRKIPTHIRAWPGAGTAFAELRALLPNHYLDLRSREAVRYFPNARLEPIGKDEAVELIVAQLRASVAAVHRDHSVFQQITAGLDSRTMLAASREFRDTTTYFTCLWPTLEPGMTERHPDIAVPRSLLAELGLRHTRYDCPSELSEPGFAIAYERADTLPIRELGPPAHALAQVLPGDAMVINNNLGELGRCYLHPVAYPASVSLSTLCNMHWTGMQDHPYLIAHLGAWMEEANAACGRLGYRMLDLFHWEMKAGRRVSRGLLHLDLAHDTFSPFNCRWLQRHYLAVPEMFRRPATGLALQHEVIRAMWPETLARAINPRKPGDRVRRVLRRARRHCRRVGLPI